jgi:hypothetical protein
MKLQLTASFRFCIVVLLLIAGTTSILAQTTNSTQTLTPLADAYVRNGGFAGINYGTDTSLLVKSSSSSGYTRYSYMKFSLSNISNITSAKLRIYGYNTENTSLINVSVYSVSDDSWTETGITWNNKPATATTALNAVSVNNITQYYEIDITNFIIAEASGDKVASLVLLNPSTQNRLLSFNSKENAKNSPQLVVTTSSTASLGNPHLFVKNLDGFPSNDHFVASRIQIPWSRDGVTYNVNHDTARIRIHNKGIDPLTISNIILSDNSHWKFLKLKGVAYNSATAFPLTISSGDSADLLLQFIAVDQATRVKVLLDNLTIVSNDDMFPNKVIYLHGLWQKRGEGGSEPYSQEIINAFGYLTKTGYSHSDPDAGSASKPKGDEILSSYFVRADSDKPVTVTQLAAYHGCCTTTETFRWYSKGTSTYNSLFTHIGVDGQSLLPRKGKPNTLAAGSFSPSGAFGFRIATSYTDTLKNYQHKLGIRIYKAIDANGRIIPNSYIVSNDYLGTTATNFDYNDNLYYITNITPEIGTAYYSALSSTPSAVDFGEKLLGSSNTFSLSLNSLGKTYSNGSSDPAIIISSIAIVGENKAEFSATMPGNTILSPQGTTTLTVSFIPATEGLKIADLLIYHNNSNSPYRVPLYGIGKASGTTVKVNYRINSGSSTAITINGKTWSADNLYSFDNLEPYSNSNLKSIAATDEDAIYLREQSSNGDKKPFRYEFPVANGKYVVRLHFAEIYWGNPGSGLSGGPGSRVMSVSLENQLGLINFDVAGEVGSASAIVKNIPATVTDGKLNINFSATVNRPMVCGVEVYSFTTSTTTTSQSNETLMVDAASISTERTIVYPNPLKKTFRIAFSSAYKGKTLLKLMDISGRVYLLGEFQLQAGKSNMEIDISKWQLKPGMYFLGIYSDTGKYESVKLMIE